MLCSGAPLNVHNSKEEPSFTFPTHRFQLGLQLATSQLQVTTSLYFSATVIHTQNSPWTSSLCSVFSLGADPSLAALTDVFKDTGCWGINQQKSPILMVHSTQSQVDQIAIEKPSSPTHPVAGRGFSLSDSWRLQLMMTSFNSVIFILLHFFPFILERKARYKFGT